MGRADLLREICRISGITSYLWRNLPAGLYVFNYHRIGVPSTTGLDPGVFSCTDERFSEHVDLIRSRFEVVGVASLLAMIEGGTTPARPTAMITFDDGYRDNFTLAFPVLRAAGTPAVFFLTTSFVGSHHPPWWDEVFWQARRITQRQIGNVPWLRDVVVEQPRAQFCREVLRAFKRTTSPIDEKLSQLRGATGLAVDASESADLFMTWDEVRALRRSGMDIGAHSHTHPILSHLTAAEQRAELATAKRVLEAEIGEEIGTVAYPVGGRLAYSPDTIEAARSCGYRAAFTFVPGVNHQPSGNPFELRRIGVEGNVSASNLRFAVASLSMAGGKGPLH